MSSRRRTRRRERKWTRRSCWSRSRWTRSSRRTKTRRTDVLPMCYTHVTTQLKRVAPAQYWFFVQICVDIFFPGPGTGAGQNYTGSTTLSRTLFKSLYSCWEGPPSPLLSLVDRSFFPGLASSAPPPHHHQMMMMIQWRVLIDIPWPLSQGWLKWDVGMIFYLCFGSRFAESGSRGLKKRSKMLNQHKIILLLQHYIFLLTSFEDKMVLLCKKIIFFSDSVKK